MMLPDVPDPFYWTGESWGPALRCRPLDPIAPHLFTTRGLQLSQAADWEQLARSVGAATAVGLTQVHGSQVVVVRRGEAPSSERPAADVLVSNNPEVAIAVRAADCVPLLLGDPETGAVAAVHAGWRGTAAGAAGAAVAALKREFGADARRLVAAIGPSIGACCYEVGSDLVDAFAAAGHERYLVDRWFQARPPARGSRERPALRLDVAGANRDQLILAGLYPGRIFDCGLCTAMHLDLLTSFRAEKERAGRLAGVVRAKG